MSNSFGRSVAKAKLSWRLVVDASVTSSASGRENLADLTPRQCKDVLDAVLKICHRFVLSLDLSEEWKRHRSQYAAEWRKGMYARKKVFPVGPQEDTGLAESILQTARTVAEEEALRKDLFLVAAALAADGIIVSRDDEARRLFRQAAAQVGRLREIVWVNSSDPDVMSWLEGELAPTPGMKLGG
jgi:hypothetical protein